MERQHQLWVAALGAAVAAGGVAIAGRWGRARSDGRPSEPALGHGAEPDSRAYRLGKWESLGEGMRRAALGRVDHALDELHGRSGDSRATAVHEARKDLKKLRAAMRLLRSQLGPETYRWQNSYVRDTGRLLSGARDAQVRLDTLDDLLDRDLVTSAAMDPFRARLERERDDAASLMRAENDAAERIERARRDVSEWATGDDDWEAIGPGLGRSYRRGRARMRDAIENPSAENLHEWRKRVKDLWYHLRLLAPAWVAVMEPLAEEAHVLSERLGDDHDLAVLAKSARRHHDAFVDPADLDRLMEAIRDRRAELLREAIPLGQRLYADKPGAFVKRTEAWWRAWRSELGVGA